MKLSALHIHPVKSCASLALTSAEVRPRGLAHDRRWMVVDGDGRFLTGRQSPRMVLLQAQPGPAGLTLRAPGLPDLVVTCPPTDAPRLAAQVWKDVVDGADAGEAAASWLSQFLGRTVRLVFMDATANRPVSPKHAKPDDMVSFADGYPLLLISQASLDGLNARLSVPVPMTRFRPNLVVSGSDAHAEDGWHRLRIGDVSFDVVKPCIRCVFTTVDPTSGAFDPSGEPLRTLKTYRRSDSGISFGMNLIPRGRGLLRVGDSVEILQ